MSKQSLLLQPMVDNSYVCRDFVKNNLFLCLWSFNSMLYIWFKIGWFSLLFFMLSNELSESVYITHLKPSLFLYLSHCCQFSYMGGCFLCSAPLIVMSANIVAKPTSLPVLFDQHHLERGGVALIRQCKLPCYYYGFLCVVRIAVFSPCHSPCVFLS